MCGAGGAAAGPVGDEGQGRAAAVSGSCGAEETGAWEVVERVPEAYAVETLRTLPLAPLLGAAGAL